MDNYIEGIPLLAYLTIPCLKKNSIKYVIKRIIKAAHCTINYICFLSDKRQIQDQINQSIQWFQEGNQYEFGKCYTRNCVMVFHGWKSITRGRQGMSHLGITYECLNTFNLSLELSARLSLCYPLLASSVSQSVHLYTGWRCMESPHM